VLAVVTSNAANGTSTTSNCVDCPPGTYRTEREEKCTACDPGVQQDRAALGPCAMPVAHEFTLSWAYKPHPSIRGRRACLVPSTVSWWCTMQSGQRNRGLTTGAS
jgi:hypothetical protein